MLIENTSVFTGIKRTRDIDITEDQLQRWLNGELIQNVCPHLSRDDREFIMTGITPEEWDQVLGSKGEADTE